MMKVKDLLIIIDVMAPLIFMLLILYDILLTSIIIISGTGYEINTIPSMLPLWLWAVGYLCAGMFLFWLITVILNKWIDGIGLAYTPGIIMLINVAYQNTLVFISSPLYRGFLG